MWLLHRKSSSQTQTKSEVKINSTLIILERLINLINREDLIRNEIHQFETVQHTKSKESLQTSIRLYLGLEKFIIEHSPPIVKKSYSRESLREFVTKSIDLATLPPEFRILFIPEQKQAIHLFTLKLPELFTTVEALIGTKKLQMLLSSVTKNTPLSGIENQKNYDSLATFAAEKLQSFTNEEIPDIFRNFYTNFYTLISQMIGKNQAYSLLEKEYSFIKSIYDFDLFKEFLSVLPAEIAINDQVSILSKTELEQQIATHTKDLLLTKQQLERKIHEFEENNKTLEDTKKAVLNLLEDAKLLEDQLKEERDLSDAVLSSMGEGLYVIDKIGGRVILFNPEAKKLLGLSSSEVIGKKWSDLLSILKDNQPLPIEQWPVSITLKTGKTIKIEADDNYSYQTKSAGSFPVDITSTPLMGNGVTGAVVIFRNISFEKQIKASIEKQVVERTKQLEEKTKALEHANEEVSQGWFLMQREKARLSESIESLPLGFIITDKEENIFILNSAARYILEVDTSLTTLSQVENLFPKTINLHLIHQQIYTDKKTVSIGDIVYGKKILHLSMTPIIVPTKQNEFIGIAVLIEDITEAKILERSRDEFFSIASHELRTPLTAIRGNASLIKEYFLKDLKDPQLVEMINDIHESSIRLIEIVNDFLDTSRLEQERFEFKKEEFDVSTFVSEVLKEFQTTGSEKKLSLTFEPPAVPIPNVFADRNRSKQVLINLIGNALKFTESGGITIQSEVSDGFAKILIKDTGKGIPLEMQNLLFHKFQQAGESLFTRDQTRGTGLGLYISKLMIKGMGGQIKLEFSEVDKGSTFSFTLPLASEKIPEIHDSKNSEIPENHPVTSM